jgi:hypothetical protein
MANLDAIVDSFLHPDIPYFHPEHIIIGGVTAFVSVVLIGIIFYYMRHIEQGRIGRDLHDDLGQILTGVSFKAKVLRDKIVDQLPVELDDIEEILRYLLDCKERASMLAQGLMSLDTEEWNLARSLQSMARNTEKSFRYHVNLNAITLIQSTTILPVHTCIVLTRKP